MNMLHTPRIIPLQGELDQIFGLIDYTIEDNNTFYCIDKVSPERLQAMAKTASNYGYNLKLYFHNTHSVIGIYFIKIEEW